VELSTVISAGASVLSFSVIVFIVPLVKYVVSTKDKQIEELKGDIGHISSSKDEKIEELKESMSQDRNSRCCAEDRLRLLEKQVDRYGFELEMSKGIHAKLETITERVESIAREMSSVQTSLAFLARGRVVSVPRPNQEAQKEG
jgi:hypothetical protein